MKILELLFFLPVSLLSVAIIYLKIPTQQLMQVVAVMLVFLLVFINKFGFANKSITGKNWYKLALLSSSSIFVQFLVLTTGGLKSPLLILVHLYALGLSFLFNFKTTLSFLFFTVSVLIFAAFANVSISNLLQQDPWSLLLYLISFIIIIPLAQVLINTYHIKDALTQALSEHIVLTQLREQSILKGLKELVFVTDENLMILYANEAAEKTFLTTSQMLIQHHLFEVVKLEDEKGNTIDPSFLAIDKALIDKASRIVEGLSLKTKITTSAIKVTLQIRPIEDSEGIVKQVVFVITDAEDGGYFKKQILLEQAHTKQRKMADELKKNLKGVNLSTLATQVELLTKIEEDLIIAMEVVENKLEPRNTFADIALICKQVVVGRQPLAQSLGVPLQFNLPQEEAAENAYLVLKEKDDLPQSSLPISDFTLPVDANWFGVLVQKIVEIALLLTSREKLRLVEVLVRRADRVNFTIEVIASYTPFFDNIRQSELFQEYYGSLGVKTNLIYGSGLEGFIAKKVATALNLPLEVKSEINPNRLVFKISLVKTLSK